LVKKSGRVRNKLLDLLNLILRRLGLSLHPEQATSGRTSDSREPARRCSVALSMSAATNLEPAEQPDGRGDVLGALHGHREGNHRVDLIVAAGLVQPPAAARRLRDGGADVRVEGGVAGVADLLDVAVVTTSALPQANR
jgi:hypothetical protein